MTMTRTHSTLKNGIRTARRQQGSILLVSLIILLVLTILGVTTLSSVAMEERMAGNLRDGDLAFQAAEAALRVGENWLAPQTVEPALCTTIGNACSTVWGEGVLPDLSYQDSAWWNLNGRDYTNNDGGGTFLTGGDTADNGPHANNSYVTAAPQFIIQLQKFVRDSNVVGHSNKTEGDIFYLITAHGFGGSEDAESLLQTSYTKRF
jgi:type IV pilus assembly protein PilX